MRRLLCFLLLTAVVRADVVVTTGDSITKAYSSLAQNVIPIAEGGLSAEGYVGALNSSTRDYAQEVVDLNPDVIVFMLGANDSFRGNVTEVRFDLYTTHVRQAFDEFATTNATTIVMSILPIYYPNTVDDFGEQGQDGMNARLANDYNPWLQAQVAARPNFRYLDVNTAMQQETDWETLLLSDDGLHPSEAGYLWLANQVNAAVTTVPEPSQWAFFVVVGGVLSAAKRLQRFRFAG